MFKRKTLLRLYILWTLEKSPKCGYDIRKDLETLFEVRMFSHPALYITLHELSGQGLVTGAPGSRNKTVYSITENGSKELEQEKTVARDTILQFREFYEDILECTIGGESDESS